MDSSQDELKAKLSYILRVCFVWLMVCLQLEYCWLKQRDTAPSLPAVVVLLSDCHVEAILSGNPGDCINEELTDGSA